MISNAWMEQWSVGMMGKREVGLIADRRRAEPLKATNILRKQKNEGWTMFSSA